MSRAGRKTNGPLSPVQRQVMDGLLRGERQKDMAEELGCSEAHVSDELYVARCKLKADTTPEAAGRMSEALTYLRAATLVEKAKVHRPTNDVDLHVNHVLDGIAAEYRKLAAKILPGG